MKRTLTVGQLIELLESLPQDAEILVYEAGSFEVNYATKAYYEEDFGAVIIE